MRVRHIQRFDQIRLDQITCKYVKQTHRLYVMDCLYIQFHNILRCEDKTAAPMQPQCAHTHHGSVAVSQAVIAVIIITLSLSCHPVS